METYDMKLVKVVATGAVLAAAALLATGAAAAPLVTNGDFANVGGVYVPNVGYGSDDWLTAGATAIPGWTNVGGPGGTGNEMWIQPINTYGLTASPVSISGYFVDLTGQGNNQPYGGLEQTIATTAGQNYLMTFYLGGDTGYDGGYSGTNPPLMTASAAGVSQDFTFTPTGPNQWVKETLSFTASSASSTIEFLGDASSPNYYIGLDSVSVAAVPEPATWAMMLLGVGMVGAGLRMARRKNDMALTAA
jgi:hypothetical protein